MAKVDVVNQLVWYAIRQRLPQNTRLTSVYRSAEEQLGFIVAKAKANGYKFEKTPTVKDSASWQGALDFLRQKNYTVAAPGRSFHEKGIAYDLSGPDLKKIETSIRAMVSDGTITLSDGSKSSILIEKRNHCVHVEIQAAILYGDIYDYA